MSGKKKATRQPPEDLAQALIDSLPEEYVKRAVEKVRAERRGPADGTLPPDLS